MAQGADRMAWNRTSAILAMLANVNRKKGSRAILPRVFNPYAGPAPPPVKETKLAFACLKVMAERAMGRG